MLCWNMQRLFRWSEYLSERSKPLGSHAMLEHAKIVWVIRTSLLRDQSHWTHILYWNMQRLFEWSKHPFWKTRATGLTCYVGTCKDCGWSEHLSEKSEPLGSHAILEHAEIVWVIRTSLLKDQSHWTYILYWNIQRLFEWSEHFFWEIRATGLTYYIGTYKDCLSDQNISFERLEPLDSHPMLEHAKIVWLIRTSLLRDQSTGLTCYIRTCKDFFSDQNISFERSEPLYLHIHPILEHAKIFWMIKTSILRN